MNNSKLLTAAEGYKYLPTILADEINLYNENKDKVVHPLVEQVSNFDRSYNFTDDGNVWRRANGRCEELKKEIFESTDFTDIQRNSLLEGLELNGLDQLTKTFPELNNKLSHNAETILELLDSGKYDEKRLTKIMDLMIKFDVVFKNTTIESYSDLLVKTPSTSKYSREDLVNFKKVALSNTSHNTLMSILNELTDEDVVYYYNIRHALGMYVNGGTKNSPNYVKATLLPDINTYIRYTTSNDFDVVKIGSSLVNWNIVVIL